MTLPYNFITFICSRTISVSGSVRICRLSRPEQRHRLEQYRHWRAVQCSRTRMAPPMWQWEMAPCRTTRKAVTIRQLDLSPCRRTKPLKIRHLYGSIVLISIDRSIEAFTFLGGHLTSHRIEMSGFIELLNGLRNDIEKLFHDTRNFIRPGLDE